MLRDHNGSLHAAAAAADFLLFHLQLGFEWKVVSRHVLSELCAHFFRVPLRASVPGGHFERPLLVDMRVGSDKFW